METPNPKSANWAVCVDRDGHGFLPIFWRKSYNDAFDLAKAMKQADPTCKTCVSHRADGVELFPCEAKINRLNSEIRKLRAQITDLDREIVHTITDALLFGAQRGWQIESKQREGGKIQLRRVGYPEEISD